jgi:hypothetical protein
LPWPSAALIGGVFAILDLIPTAHNAFVVPASITWNCTSGLNIAFLMIAVARWRFFNSGGMDGYG